MKLDDRLLPEPLTIDVPQLTVVANLAISDGTPGRDVLKINAKTRLTELNFPESIRMTLEESYSNELVSLCGVFLLKNGVAKTHIPQDFPKENWKSKKELETDWLKYFEMEAPLVCASIIHSMDRNASIFLEHSHCFNDRGDGGHFHNDTTPGIAEYEGYFAPAEALYRIDQVFEK